MSGAGLLIVFVEHMMASLEQVSSDVSGELWSMRRWEWPQIKGYETHILK